MSSTLYGRHVAKVLREGGDVAAAREVRLDCLILVLSANAAQALSLLLATLRFVELNLIAVRKIVKKRDKFATRGGFTLSDRQGTELVRSGQIASNSRATWLLCPKRSRHLECLESFEPQFAALLVSARAIRESRAFGAARGPPTLNVAQIPLQGDDSRLRPTAGAPARPGSALERKATNSMMGTLIATGDAADARALAELIDSCEQALSSAQAARKDLRHHASAMQALGVDADVDYAKRLSRQTKSAHLHHLGGRGEMSDIYHIGSSVDRDSYGTRLSPLELHEHAQFRQSKRRTLSESMPFRVLAIVASWFGSNGNTNAMRWRNKDDYTRAALDCDAEDVDNAVTAEIASRRIALAAQCSSAALFSASCYAIAPTVHEYTTLVHAPDAFAGLLLAASPLASLGSRYAMSEWCRRARVGFKPPVILGGALCCAGNLLYFVAPRLVVAKCQLPLALFARIAVGASGGADAVNRRYIGTADLPPSDRGAAAARYVASDALGVALGPLLAAFCADAASGSPRNREKVGNRAVLTMPSLVLAAAWAVHALFVALLWREDKASTEPDSASLAPPMTQVDPISATGSCTSASGSMTVTSPIPLTTDVQAEAGTSSALSLPTSTPAPAMSPRPGPWPPPARDIQISTLQQRQLNVQPLYGAVAPTEGDDFDILDSSRRTACDFFMLPTASQLQSAIARLFATGVVHEILLASSAFVSDHVFGWSPRISGLMLCGLRLAALASTRQAEDLAERIDERLLSIGAGTGTLLAAILLAFWPLNAREFSLGFWLVASFVAFACAEVMAVAERALVAKLASSSAPKRSPIITICARVCGDLMFSLASMRYSTRSIMIVLWLPPSVALGAALASMLLGVDLACRATEGP